MKKVLFQVCFSLIALLTLTSGENQTIPTVPRVKAIYEVMPVEVLKKITQMKSAGELESVRPPAEFYWPILFKFGAGRSGGFGIGGAINAKGTISGWHTDGCRRVFHYSPDTLMSPENRKHTETPSLGICTLDTPASVIWEKVRRLTQAVLDSDFPALPLTQPPYWGIPAYSLPRDNHVTFGFELTATNGYFEGIQWKYAMECSPGDPKCEAIWKVVEEEFWLPIKTRYPWLPEIGSPVWREKTPEREHYEQTSPIVECYEYDIGKPTARTVCTPDGLWTEEDEKKLKEAIAREKANQNARASNGKG